MTLPDELRHSLLSSDTSRQNKLWLVTGWIHVGYDVDWMWVGEPMKSRMAFRFERDGKFIKAKSYDEDILTKLKDPKKPKFDV